MNQCPLCSRSLPSSDAKGCSSCGWSAPAEEISLSPDQRVAWDLLESGRSVFVTGPAGTGKTFLVERWLREGSARQKSVAVCASTGAAAVHIGGRTLHSWMGMGIGKESAERIAEDPRWGWKFRIAPRIRSTEILVIDEVSQVNGKTFALVSDLCKIARGPRGAITSRQRVLGEQREKLPFGGLQLVLIGDMGQLEPVEAETGFPFETAEWWDADIVAAELTTVHRQADAQFVRVLNECRHGILGPEGAALLQSRVRAFDPDADPPAVRLAIRNAMVDAVNDARLAEVPGDAVTFEANEEGDRDALDRIDKNCLSPRRLALKVGARVMFTRNDPSNRWVNGTLGTVTWLERSRAGGHSEQGEGGVEVTTDDGLVVCPERVAWQTGEGDIYVPEKWTKKLVKKRNPGKGEAARVQYPLRLGWSFSVHKAQGLTISRVSIDLGSAAEGGGCFAAGQAYVALSRARTLEGLNIEKWDGPASVVAHPTAVSFIRGEYRPPEEYQAERRAREAASAPAAAPSSPPPSEVPSAAPSPPASVDW